jgi:hypothetical protein
MIVGPGDGSGAGGWGVGDGIGSGVGRGGSGDGTGGVGGSVPGSGMGRSGAGIGCPTVELLSSLSISVRRISSCFARSADGARIEKHSTPSIPGTVTATSHVGRFRTHRRTASAGPQRTRTTCIVNRSATCAPTVLSPATVPVDKTHGGSQRSDHRATVRSRSDAAFLSRSAGLGDSARVPRRGRLLCR